ncbi:aldo/keto reductase [Spirochaetia bacterium]|nr:aldo/keto reductase [Spirochaetia bacterium]GHU94468.1 aldo/keto reductase [Spirochaetia bacterium]
MTTTTLGRTGLKVNKDAFGALPVQRVEKSAAVKLLQKALDGGINLFDSARGYSDSEEKIGAAFSGRRDKVIIATKTGSKDAETFWEHLETSLSTLKTDYIDVYQFHNPDFVPRPGDGTGLYEAILKAKEQGKIRFIGISNHRVPVAKEAVESGLYDTLQFPFNYLSDDQEIALVKLCLEKNVGFIAMKALSGGLLTDIGACHGWLAQFSNVVPIWGIQRESELDALFSVMNRGAELSAVEKSRIEADRKELAGTFCRGCGYCMPCPAGILINTCARMSLLIRRAPSARFLGEEWQQEMGKIKNCKHCGHCTSHCPYGLDTPALLAKNYEDYQQLLRA